MIGALLLLWGIGIIVLAFKLQTQIQVGTDAQAVYARELYNDHPFIFCTFTALSLAGWPLILVYVIVKKKGTTHGN